MTNSTLNSITFVPLVQKLQNDNHAHHLGKSFSTKPKAKWGPHDLRGLGHDYKQNKTLS